MRAMDVALIQTQQSALTRGGGGLNDLALFGDDGDRCTRIALVIDEHVIQSSILRIDLVGVNYQIEEPFRENTLFDRRAHFLAAEFVDQNLELPVAPGAEVKRRLCRHQSGGHT